MSWRDAILEAAARASHRAQAQGRVEEFDELIRSLEGVTFQDAFAKLESFGNEKPTEAQRAVLRKIATRGRNEGLTLEEQSEAIACVKLRLLSVEILSFRDHIVAFSLTDAGRREIAIGVA